MYCSGFQSFKKNVFLLTFIAATSFSLQAYSANHYTLTNDDVEVEDGVIVSCTYLFDCKNIVIPAYLDNQKITGVATKVFAEKSITTVTLPESIRSIGPGAFAKNNFVRLQLPDSIEVIDDYAFAKSNLTSVQLPSNLKTLGEYAFTENIISKIIIPESVESIGKFAFAFNGMKEIVFSPKPGYSGCAFNRNNVSRINNRPTKGLLYKAREDGSVDSANITGYCGGQKIVDFIPEGVDTISIKAFVACELSSIVLPNSVRYLDDEVFLNNKLKNVVFSTSLNYIGRNCFETNLLTSLTLPPSVEMIGFGAFSRNKIISVDLPDSVKKIDRYAFHRNDIKAVELPEGLEYIGYEAFGDNELTSVNLPQSLIEFDPAAFSGNKITSLIVPNPVSKDFIEWRNNDNEVIPVGYKITTSYSDVFKSTTYKAYFKHVLNETDVFIEDGVIKDYDRYYKHIIIPEKIDGQTVLGINDEVFSRRGVCSVQFPESLLEIGEETFYGNYLKKIDLPDNIQFVGERCFYANDFDMFKLPATNDTNFMYWYVGGEYTINSGVWISDMKHKALYKCVQKVLDTSDVTIENHVITEYKGDSKFIYIPNEIGGQVIKGIYETAFYEKKLYYVRLPDSLTAIGPSAFAFNHLKSVKIPPRVNRIYHYAFHLNRELESVEFVGQSKLLFIGTGAFADTDIKSFVLPERPDIKKAYWKDGDKNKYLPGSTVSSVYKKYYLDVNFKKYLE